MARTHVRLNGTLGSAGQERWSCGLNFNQLPVLDQAGVSAAAVLIGTAVEGAWSTDYPLLRNLLSSSGALTDIDVYAYNTTGPAIAGGTYQMTSPLSGTGTITAPPQCSCVFSLLTGLAGSSRRGRVYWPALGATVNASLVESTMPAAGEDFAALAKTIEDELDTIGDATFAVYSPTLGVLTPVSSVSTGNVIDTQRRRRDALAEFRVNYSYPP